LLSFDINDVSVAAASASNAVFLDLVSVGPIFVFLDPFLLIVGSLLEIGDTSQLASWSVGWTMLDGSVPVSEITEVVDVAGCKESTGSE
jgi:hypothetical protein